MMQNVLLVTMIIVLCVQVAAIKEIKETVPILQNVNITEQTIDRNSSNTTSPNLDLKMIQKPYLGSLNKTTSISNSTKKIQEDNKDVANISNSTKIIQEENKNITNISNSTEKIQEANKDITKNKTTEVFRDDFKSLNETDSVQKNITYNIDDVEDFFEDGESSEKNNTLKLSETKNDDAFLQSIMKNDKYTTTEVNLIYISDEDNGEVNKTIEEEFQDDYKLFNVTVPLDKNITFNVADVDNNSTLYEDKNITIIVNEVEDNLNYYEDGELFEKNNTFKIPEAQNDDAFLQSLMKTDNLTTTAVIIGEHSTTAAYTKSLELLDLHDNVLEGNTTNYKGGDIDEDFEEGSIPIISDKRAGHNSDGTIDEVFLSFVSAIHKYEVDQEAKENKRLQAQAAEDEESFYYENKSDDEANLENEEEEKSDEDKLDFADKTNEDMDFYETDFKSLEHTYIQDASDNNNNKAEKAENNTSIIRNIVNDNENQKEVINKPKKLQVSKINEVKLEETTKTPQHTKNEEKLAKQSTTENVVKVIEDKDLNITNKGSIQEIKGVKNDTLNNSGEGNKKIMEGI